MNCVLSDLLAPPPRLNLPVLQGSRADWHSQLARPRALVAGEVAGRRWRLAAGGQPATKLESVRIPLTLAEVPCELRLAPALLTGLRAGLPVRKSWASLTPEVQALLLEHAALPFVEALESLLDGRLRVTTLAPAEPLDYRLALRVGLDGAAELPCSLHLPADLAERVVAALERAWPGRRTSLSELPLPVERLAGWQRLTTAECRALRPGDVVMLEEARLDTCLLQLAGSWQVRAHYRPDAALHLIAPFVRTPLAAEDSIVSEQQATAFDDLPVTLQCRVGTLELTLAELQALGPGSVLALPGREEALVELVVNGRTLGRGELVALGDGVGVRVTRFIES